MKRAVCLGASAVLCCASSTQAQAWHSVQFIGGRVSVGVPCSETGLEPSNGSGDHVTCDDQGLVFRAGIVDDGTTYDDILADNRDYPVGKTVRVITLTGHRAFRISRPASKGFLESEVVEYQPGTMVMMGVEPSGGVALAPADIPAAELRAEQFLNSLEILG